jgi:hypothetical protein
VHSLSTWTIFEQGNKWIVNVASQSKSAYIVYDWNKDWHNTFDSRNSFDIFLLRIVLLLMYWHHLLTFYPTQAILLTIRQRIRWRYYSRDIDSEIHQDYLNFVTYTWRIACFTADVWRDTDFDRTRLFSHRGGTLHCKNSNQLWYSPGYWSALGHVNGAQPDMIIGTVWKLDYSVTHAGKVQTKA